MTEEMNSQQLGIMLRIKNAEYIVAAYVWPSCHDEPMARENLWSEGIGERGIEVRNEWDAILDIPFFPNVAVGWDNTPQSFGAYLQNSKEYADKHPDQPKIITIYAWNEWVEGCYLYPTCSMAMHILKP